MPGFHSTIIGLFVGGSSRVKVRAYYFIFLNRIALGSESILGSGLLRIGLRVGLKIESDSPHDELLPMLNVHLYPCN